MKMRDADYARLGLVAPRQSAPLPSTFQDVASLIDEPVRNTPGAVALVGRNVRYTFAELDRAVNAAAAGLHGLGLTAGDRMAMACRNDPQIMVCFLASQRLGLVWSGINGALATREKVAQLADMGARLLVAEADTVAAITQHLAELPQLERLLTFDVDSEDGTWLALCRANLGAGRPDMAIDPHAPAVIAYTSGTTGVPKGVVHSQHNFATIAAMSNVLWGDERVTGACMPAIVPNFFGNWLLPIMSWGGTAVCMDRKDPQGIVGWIEREGIQSFSIPPTLIHDILNSPDVSDEDLASVQRIRAGSSATSPEIRQRFSDRFGFELEVGYGLTEAPGCVSATLPRHPINPRCSGRALPHIKIAAYDKTGRELAAGEAGLIGISAAQTGPYAGIYTPMLGYWRKLEASNAVLKGGVLMTGDIGTVMPNGDVIIESRASDVIVRGGSNVYPGEIERVLAFDWIEDVAILGAPDERLGEIIVAFVQLRKGIDRAASLELLIATCKAQLAKYKQPDRWIFVDAMPRNSLQKVLKPALRDLIADTVRTTR
jgi:long-chain acyl-CoA synthetase